MSWMSCEHDSFSTDIDCESRVWFGIDGHDSCSINADHDMRAWFVIEEHGSCSMNINHMEVE